MRAIWQRLIDDQRGQLIAIAMAILGLGVAVVIPAIAYVGASMRGIDASTGHAEERYAAEAMVEAVMADLRQGVDVLHAAYMRPSPAVNGYTPAVSVYSAVIPFPRVRVFADPGTTTTMDPLAPGASFTYVVEGAQADTDVVFSWNYTPGFPGAGEDTRIEVFKGFSTDTADRILNNLDNNSPHQIALVSGVNGGGTFTVRFTNESAVHLTSAAFGDEGQAGLTWMSLVAGVDYILTAEAGNSVVQAYLQVGPGGGGPRERSVAIRAWLEPRDYFSDLQLGGATSGWVLDSGGLDVSVTDLAGPSGFQVDVTGGAETARVVLCGFTLLLDAGDSIAGTCELLLLETLAGNIDVITDPRINLDVLEGTLATISKTDRNTTLVANDSSSAEAITATVTLPTRTGIVVVPPGATVEIVLPPEGGGFVRVPLGSLPITVDIGNGPVTVGPGEIFILEPEPTPGLRGVKLAAIELLRLHAHESSRIQDAIGHIEDSIEEPLWVDDTTLDHKRGSSVFRDEKRAVKDLMTALDWDDLPSDAQEAAERVIDDLVSVDRALAVAALDLSLASELADPDDDWKVERKQDDAQEQIDEGDDDLEDGRPDKAIDHYRRAWQYAQDALTYQVPPRDEAPDEPGDGSEDGGELADVRSALLAIVQALGPIQDDSNEVEDAIERIVASMRSSLWMATSSLNPEDGDEVFDLLEDAADELEDALDNDDLGVNEQGVVQQAAEDLAAAARTLAFDQLQRSLNLPSLEDGDDQRDVERDQEDALDDLNDGDEEREIADWDKAIDAYGKAWKHATAALDEQGYFDSQGDPDEDGDNELGLRGAIESVIDDIDGYRDQSNDINAAFDKLQASLTPWWWTGHSTLDVRDGSNVFDKLEDAVDVLDNALDDDGDELDGDGGNALSNSASLAVDQAINDITAIARALANDQLQRSLALPDLHDWRDQRNVERDQEDAQDKIDDGDEERDDRDYDNAIDDYRNAWDHATDALQQQGAL